MSIDLGGKEDFTSLSRPLEPFPKQVLAVLIDIGTVPEGHPQLISTIQDLESLLIAFGSAVEGT